MSWLQNLLKIEFSQIQLIQNKFQGWERILSFFSQYLGPSTITDIAAPLAGAFNGELLVELMVAGAFSDVLGLIIKWIVSEDRPYWWVQETPVYQGLGLSRPTIRQHKLTCETTSGSPSGHSVAVTILFYLLFKHIMRVWEAEEERSGATRIVRVSLITIFSLLIGLMWLARLYFGCHFFHQCLLGTTLSLFVINCLQNPMIKRRVYEANKLQALVFALFVSGLAGGVYFAKQYAGIDPHWSVRMAFKWCEDPHYLKHEATPIYAIVKHIGSLFGIALSSPLKDKWLTEVNPWIRVPLTTITIVANQIIISMTPKNYGRFAFLSYVFGVNFLFAFILLTVIPYFCGEKKKTE